jgi:hypothetical protein
MLDVGEVWGRDLIKISGKLRPSKETYLIIGSRG